VHFFLGYARSVLGRARRRILRVVVPFHGPPASAATLRNASSARLCNICGWSGAAFLGSPHSESNQCPQCGSIARDRFVYYLAFNKERARVGSAVIETSPRLGQQYRSYLRHNFRYRTGDFDQVSHKGDLFLDLQDMSLPTSSIDVFITSHVLEHVPDPTAAARELYRVVKPAGRAIVVVPLLQGTTSVPSVPEYHEDHTLVHWRFGWGLKDLLAGSGLDVEIAITDDFAEVIRNRRWDGDVSGEFDLASLIQDAPPVIGSIDQRSAELLGIQPPYQFVAFVCRKS
jgi:SAM-dependent methyltransferase